MDSKLNKPDRPLAERRIESNQHLRTERFEMSLPSFILNCYNKPFLAESQRSRPFLQDLAAALFPRREYNCLIDVRIRLKPFQNGRNCIKKPLHLSSVANQLSF